jgi:methylthioribulose-1-phosphate dehydratase
MQKAFSQITTHEGYEKLPILPNSQDMVAFSKEVEHLLQSQPDIHGFLIRGHGLYTWGSSLAEAQRHIEAYEFLFDCMALELAGI